jgi:hypothetical protein
MERKENSDRYNGLNGKRTVWVIRNTKSKKERQYNGHKKKYK